MQDLEMQDLEMQDLEMQDLERTSACDPVIKHGLPDLMFGTGCECGGSVHEFSEFGQLRQGAAPFVASA
jgi:hypothetical protein